MIRVPALTLSLLLAGFCAACRPPASAESPGSGFSSQRLDRNDQAIGKAEADGEIPGAVALIARDGQIVYHKAFGHADIESGKKMTTNTIFRIASMTKAITSVGAMVLYEQGHFRLSDPVSNYLPAFTDMQVIARMGEDGSVIQTAAATRDIRIIDLLSHTSGLSYPFMPSKLQKTYVDAGVIDGITARDVVLADQMELLARNPLLFQPGSQFAYSLSTDLLGRLLEVVSAQPLDVFLAEHVTEPLQMRDTHFYLPPEKADRLATLYAHVDGKGLVVSKGTESSIKLDNPNYPVEGARKYFSGGGGMSSTASDYGRFIQMLLNDGQLDGVRVLSRKSVELMRTARTDRNGDTIRDFGLGFAVESDLGIKGELGSTDAYSWGGAFYTSYWIDPRENLIGVFMSQARPVKSDIAAKFNMLAYQALE